MLKNKNIQIYFHDTLIIQYEIVEVMYKTSIAVMLVIGFALSFATSNAYASGWDKDPWYATPMNKKVNKSNTEPYDVRQSHEKGWHNSKVCGVDLCSEKTATEASTFKGLDAGGAKTSKKGAFDGKFYMKGNFIFRK